jgi:hypothetical protein
MYDDTPAASPLSPSPTSDHALVLLGSSDPTHASDWQAILHAQNQVVLYNPTNHALSVRPRALPPSLPATHNHASGVCPYCARALPVDFDPHFMNEPSVRGDEEEAAEEVVGARVDNYFQLLEIANETWSRPSTPGGARLHDSGSEEPGFAPHDMAGGYFKTFFKEERRLGMGAGGSVYLCQVGSWA